MTENESITCRKSWVAYVGEIKGTLVAAAILNGILYGVHWFMQEQAAPAKAFGYLETTAWVLNGLLVLELIYSLFYLRTVQWIADDEGVRIREGILPWRKHDLLHPYETIFEAYYEFGFFAKLLGYGTCHIRRTEGITTEISSAQMHRASRITGFINEKLKALRKGQRAPVVAETRPSAAEELTQLARLRENGTLSEDEFETMKRKIIEG